MVLYTETITNPGTVSVHSVRLTDDKCSPVEYVSGDTNNDAMLGTTETWIYTCASNLTQTTTNTATASGQANGFFVRDFAIATVVVANAMGTPPVVPTFPNTGSDPSATIPVWFVIISAIYAIAIILSVFREENVS